jgi:signal transduction histidine kinase
MRERQGACDPEMDVSATEQMGRALHELCQPLTTLQCRLEIAALTGTAEAYREMVELGLVECARLMEIVSAMQGIVRAARSAEAGELGESR